MLYQLWSPYHFSGQTIGITMLYARRHDYRLDGWLRRSLSTFVVGTFVLQAARFEVGDHSTAFFGVTYPSLGLPAWTPDAAAVGMWASAAAFVRAARPPGVDDAPDGAAARGAARRDPVRVVRGDARWPVPVPRAVLPLAAVPADRLEPPAQGDARSRRPPAVTAVRPPRLDPLGRGGGGRWLRDVLGPPAHRIARRSLARVQQCDRARRAPDAPLLRRRRDLAVAQPQRPQPVVVVDPRAARPPPRRAAS